MHMRMTLLALAAVILPLVVLAQPQSADPLVDRARRLLRDTPVIDGHNDYPWEVRQRAQGDLTKLDMRQPQPAIMTDFARLRREASARSSGRSTCRHRRSGTDPAASVTQTLEQIDIVHRMVARYPDALALALTADDVERAIKQGRIASLIGMEGGHSINSSIPLLRMMYRLGARYMTLTHSLNMPWADSATDTPAARRPDAVRRRGRPGNEPARHARRSEPRLAGDDGGRDPGRDRAGDLFALVGAGPDRRPAQRAGRHPARSCRRTAAS